jgi:hypothetical protein
MTTSMGSGRLSYKTFKGPIGMWQRISFRVHTPHEPRASRTHGLAWVSIGHDLVGFLERT